MTYDEYLAGRVIVTGEKIHSVTGRSGSGNWEDARFTEKEFKIIRMVEPSIIQTLEDIHSGMEAGEHIGGGLMSEAYSHAAGFKDDFMEYTGSYFRFRVGPKWRRDVTILPSKMALISETTKVIKRIGYHKDDVHSFLSQVYNSLPPAHPAEIADIPVQEGLARVVTRHRIRPFKPSGEVGMRRVGEGEGNYLLVDGSGSLYHLLENEGGIGAVIDKAFIWEAIHCAGYKYPLEGKYVHNL